MTNAIFLDASFWIAYRDEKDLAHALARRVIAELFSRKPHFVTTLPVICEIHAHFVRSPLMRKAILRELCENPVVTVEKVTHQDQKRALDILQRHNDKEYSLCDALSFVVMQRLHLTRSLAFDQHFRQFGEFQIIPEKFP